jgi:hypothetical protein
METEVISGIPYLLHWKWETRSSVTRFGDLKIMKMNPVIINSTGHLYESKSKSQIARDQGARYSVTGATLPFIA